MTITFYGYPKCSTCRTAQKWLAGSGVSHESVDLVQNPPAKEELRRMVEASELDIRKFFNTSGEAYRELQLKDKLASMSDEEKLQLLSSNGKLIKRPIVTDGTKVTVGFREEEYRSVWANR